jgi:hypothetical protein
MDQNRAGYGESKAAASSDGQEGPRTTMIDPDRNEALERERPDDAVFRAVFGGDSDDD